ncbi:MAG: hypothetical protein R2827_00220 [Bdellovibrionales bacterium]
MKTLKYMTVSFLLSNLLVFNPVFAQNKPKTKAQLSEQILKNMTIIPQRSIKTENGKRKTENDILST